MTKLFVNAALLSRVDGTIVEGEADYNFLFNDVHFVDYENYGFGKAIGGKIGIIRDPFGKNGEPKYLGATSPIQGGAVDHLTLGADGTLYADVFMDEVSDQGELMFKSLFVWDSAALIKEALAAEQRGQKLSVPIDRTSITSSQIATARASRYDGADGVHEFGWTYGIGSYLDPDLPVKADDPTLRDSIIQLNRVEIPFEPLKTIEEQLNPDDQLVQRYALKGFDLLVSGSYFERYGERVAKYNSGKYGYGTDAYDQFVKANVADAMLTGFATVVTFGVGGKFIGVASKIESWAARVAIGGVARGFAAGVTFDTLLQAGLLEVGRITNGVSGQTEFSWSHALTAGGFGAVLGGALGAAPRAGVAVYENAPRIVDNLLKKLGEVVGLAPSKSKTVISEAATSELSAAVKVSTPKSAGAGVEVRLRDANVPELAGSTEILIKGKVVAITPAASSKTINEAAIWYRAELNKRASAIDKTLPLEAQIIQAETLAQELMNGATASLFDKELAATLREAFARPSIEKLKNEVGGAGEKQLQAVLERSTAADKTRKWFEPGACFAAGTLVHTKEGLVPIEQIKVGDWVLSKPENGGEQAYKQVLQTFAHEPQAVLDVLYESPDDNGVFHSITSTHNHPFWLAETGWTAAKLIPAFNATTDNYSRFELASGLHTFSRKPIPIYISNQAGVGWTPAGHGDPRGYGDLWDYANQKLVATHDFAIDAVRYSQDESTWQEVNEDLCLKLPVYNLEVDDFHTYYVGKHGIWVHNTNCDGLSFEVRNGTEKLPIAPLTQKQKERPFLSRAEAVDYFKGKDLKTLDLKNEIYLMPASRPSQAGLIEPDTWARWLAHEETAPGRLVGNNNVRWEYVLPIEDPRLGNIVIGIEGAALSPTGLRINVDSKLGLVKAGDIPGALRQLETAALRWKQTGGINGGEFFRYEFPAGIRKPELIGIVKARDVLNKIRSEDSNYRFGEFQRQPDGTRLFVESPLDAERNALLREFLGVDEAHSFIELRNVGEATIFPQNVLAEGNAVSPSLLTLTQISALLPQARQYWLAAGASASLLNSASFQVADLPTGLAGQTQGTTITLDASGAGWGWFVDSTPMDQAEFDAGVSATSFTSGTSSPATGKLDLLTVLIHELGHVVGLPSTATTNDVMSQYLAPGQRRLPGAVDIAALQAEGSPYYSNGTSVTLVTPPAGNVGGLSYSQLHPAAAVVNPTLANGNFTTAQNGSVAQWETTGKVEATPSTITLGESTKAQAHLAQAFIITPQDRFLTFTVSGLNLQTNSTEQNGILTAAPQDAFEVALQNANTGANLLSSGFGTGTSNLGASHSDALLNVQLASSSASATLQERAVSGLRHTDNADGSRTYVLDLSGIAAGTAVKLSFDLIGFGLSASQLGSRVNISDVRLINAPLAVNDTDTLVEDGSATITVQTNDLNADAAGFAPRLVAGAQHGQVSVSAPAGVFGGFVYTPDANYFGADSFTYTASDGTQVLSQPEQGGPLPEICCRSHPGLAGNEVGERTEVERPHRLQDQAGVAFSAAASRRSWRP